MKQIVTITKSGILYIDEQGNQHLIDFENCLQNYILEANRGLGSDYTAERDKFYRKIKYVGRRYALSEPPAIEFYTIPPVTFTFSTRAELTEILVKIKEHGWMTNDGE